MPGEDDSADPQPQQQQDMTLRDFLLRLVRREDEQAKESVSYIHALSGLNTSERMNEHARRMGAVQDAFWKSKCPDYEPPEEDVGNNFVNCSITSDAAIQEISKLVSDKDTTVVQPPWPRPKRRPWWHWLLMFAIPLMLGALLTWLALWFFGNPVADVQYEIIARPFEPGTSLPPSGPMGSM